MLAQACHLPSNIYHQFNLPIYAKSQTQTFAAEKRKAQNTLQSGSCYPYYR